ncbi:MAG: ABC transporter substrate-binding protein [Treponema sp.]|jgi:ABC-type glycerol-3-phosphate transport system substrate-binding protein|nr:ABC transporter substrate-binding protein [Treponema sp.]
MKKLILGLLVAAIATGSVFASGAQTPSSTGGTTVAASDLPTIDQLRLGQDYTNLNVTIQVKTHRTDIVNTVFPRYIADFQKMYPNIKIVYEAITDYAETITMRLSTPNWGDLCMIPTTIGVSELGNYFQPLGALATLSQTYQFADNRMFNNTVYGLSSTNNVQGILYNKRIYQQAGINPLPKTPDEFLAALQKIKDNTSAIPLYTNFAAGWTMGAWDAYISGSATGDPNFMNQILPHAANPFSDRGDGTGPYAVYSVLYEAIRRGLVEDDPTTTDWEGSKGMMNRGEIATMVLGSWAITQMQEAGPNAADIGYMPFPITVKGKQYAGAGADYNYGVNKNSSRDARIASMLYIKYLVEQSNFDYDQGGIPTVKGREPPTTLAAFAGIDLVADNPALPGEEDLLERIKTQSEVAINMTNQHVIDIAEAAIRGNKTLKEIVDDWNARWSAAQRRYNVTIK